MSHHIATSGISTFVYEHTSHHLETYSQGTPEVLKKDQFGLRDADLLEHTLHGEIFSHCLRTAVALPRLILPRSELNYNSESRLSISVYVTSAKRM